MTCPEAEQTRQTIRERLPGYLEKLKIIIRIGLVNHQDPLDMMNEWLLPEGERSKDNGFGRKKRLQAIINNVCSASKDNLIAREVKSWKESIEDGKTLTIDPLMGRVLRGYERFIREEVIQKVSWFGMRDAVAAGVVRTVYMYFKHYIQTVNEHTPQEIKEAMRNYWASVEADEWNRDEHHQIFLSSANTGMGAAIESSLKALGYLSGMTDDVIMEFHEKAFNVFR